MPLLRTYKELPRTIRQQLAEVRGFSFPAASCFGVIMTTKLVGAMTKEIVIPKPVADVMQRLTEAGFEAYVVGGCVRDSLMGREPTDWDVTTNAKPEEIQDVFGGEESFYENQFGTVGVKTGAEEQALAVVEVTTYRIEGKYSDRRHPDEVRFSENLLDDLARRDFTMNAIAYDGKALTDPYSGVADIAAGQVRAVGEARKRFAEDALRLMRAVRFAAQLDFSIEEETEKALHAEAEGLSAIAHERIRDELIKIVMTLRGELGMELLRKYGLMEHILPELLEGVGMEQNLHHIYTVWEHNVKALQYACEQEYSMQVRVASLLHDVGKSRTKRGEGKTSTFYGHEVVGARMAKSALRRLKFSKDDIQHITMLIRQHMFNSDLEGENAVTDSGIRRLISRVGPENMEDLYAVRQADRIGSGVPKDEPYRLREFKFRVDRLLKDPISRKQLKIDGDDLIKKVGMESGPRLGAVIDALFEEVLDDPEKNTEAYLLKRAEELKKLSDEELSALRESAKEKQEAVIEEEEAKLRAKRKIR